ncbi:MAG: DM13 domain-containing protein [Nitriliruptoraceae bacterium]|nr:DM13 domain-containing protein [Nitriliruptoraceae bacterium]
MTTPTDDHTLDRPAEVDRSRRTRRWVVGGLLAVGLVAFVLWWFQPQALLFGQVVDEEFPVVDAAPAPDADAAADDEPAAAGEDEEATGADEPADVDAPDSDASDTDGSDSDAPASDDGSHGSAEDEAAAAAPTEPVELAAGSFVSRNRYTVTGEARVFDLPDGERVLRLEDFESTNGPDLFVYLTVAGADDDDAALDGDFVDLGVLTGNVGNQNYTIPAEVDLDRYDSVVIWCRRFTSSFGVADLVPLNG